MNDTAPSIAATWDRLLMARPPGERMRMACAMFTVARLCVRGGITASEPGLSEADLRVRELRRLYGNEFDSSTMMLIEQRVRAVAQG